MSLSDRSKDKEAELIDFFLDFFRRLFLPVTEVVQLYSSL